MTRAISVKRGLEALGFQEAEIDAEIAARRSEVENKAEFFVLAYGETERWQSGEEKRNWHLRNADVFVYRQLLGKIPAVGPTAGMMEVGFLTAYERAKNERS